MSKFQCRCGHVMVMRTGEEPYEHRLLRDNFWIERLSDLADKLPEKSNAEEVLSSAYGQILDDSQDVLICTRCFRIHIDFEGDNVFKSYTLED